MILLINTADSKNIFIGLIEKGGFKVKKNFKAQYKQAEKLLPAIDRMLKNNRKKIKAIVVVSGPGSFTALRIGVVTANALAYGLKVPITDISLKELEDKKNLFETIETKVKKAKTKNIIKPIYGGEPNITLKK